MKLTCLHIGVMGYFRRLDEWEPDELRGSRPVLRGREGEVPSLYSLCLSLSYTGRSRKSESPTVRPSD